MTVEGNAATIMKRDLKKMCQQQLECTQEARTEVKRASNKNHSWKDDVVAGANALMLSIKADLRALKCISLRLPSKEEAPESAALAPVDGSGISPAGERCQKVEELEQHLRGAVLLSMGGSTGRGNEQMLACLSSLTRLVRMREELVEELSQHLLQVKARLDKDFGLDFVSLQAFLRTEKEVLGNEDMRSCCLSTCRFLEMCHQFDTMANTVHALNAVKGGLNQVVLLKRIKTERDELEAEAKQLRADLHKANMSYRELTTPELLKGLEDNCRMQLEERCIELAALQDDLDQYHREHERVVVENGRLRDQVMELELELSNAREKNKKQLMVLEPKLAAAEKGATKISAEVKQMHVDMSMVRAANKRLVQENAKLNELLSAPELASGESLTVIGLERERSRWEDQITRAQAAAKRKENMSLIAMAARDEMVKAVQEVQQQLKGAQGSLEEAEAATAAAVEGKAEAEKAAASKADELSEAERDNQLVKDEMYRLKARLDMKEEEALVMQKRLARQEEEIKDLQSARDENEELSNHVRELAADMAQVERRCKVLQQELVAAHSEGAL